YIPCVSQEELNGVFFGRVTEYLSSIDLDSFSSVYLCGNRKMISDAYSVLVQRSFDPAKIFSEVFF
ncbi:hypothetical protein N9L52_07620, partial [Litoricolaceae bacterium]|nr:hypothetical protein [Litorivicinaceae bacterium]